jgi:hypothetical protein
MAGEEDVYRPTVRKAEYGADAAHQPTSPEDANNDHLYSI